MVSRWEVGVDNSRNRVHGNDQSYEDEVTKFYLMRTNLSNRCETDFICKMEEMTTKF